MKKRFEVKVKVGYDDISFGFDELERAMGFAEVCLKTAIPNKKTDGTDEDIYVSITMNAIEMSNKKEEKEDELAVQA